MKNWFISFFSISTFFLQAQYVTPSVDTVDLGVVFEDQPDSMLVYLRNQSPMWSFFTIEESTVFPFYGDTVVTVHFTNGLIYQGDSLPVWIVAKPEHNVKHKGAIVFRTGGLLGEVIIPYKFQGRYSQTYYAQSENKTESLLRTTLKTTISAGYTSLSYNNARDEMYSDLDNVSGDVECVYTGRTATFSSRVGANSNSFNCEHTFPQGFFSQNLPMRSDIHHLFSTDVNANSQRGNLPFGVVSNPTWQQGGSKKNNSTFEPRDAQKGATARAMMYFVLRYQDYSNHFAPQEGILRQWHNQHLPTAAEQNRNDGIYQLQNNRNPFVDYPQFAERITNLVGATSAAPAPAIYHEDTAFVNYQASSVGNETYRMFIVNYGNTNVDVVGFSASNSSIQFINGTGSNGTIAPRQSRLIEIEYPLNLDLDGESITFAADLGGLSNEAVYFQTLSPVFSIDEQDLNASVRQEGGYLNWLDLPATSTLKLHDYNGRLLNTARGNERAMFVGDLPNGIYVLSIKSKSQVFSQKIVISQ